MANMCDFTMKIVGNNPVNLVTFYNMISQNGTTWMGRGAEVVMDNIKEEDGRYSTILNGWCKWSVESALIDNAISMRTEPERWSVNDYDRNGNKLRFVTLYEACNELGLDMEVYSEEPGIGFSEHKLFRDGILDENKCVNYWEDYNEETDEYIPHGGFGDWKFEI